MRAELGVPGAFPPEVEAAARAAAEGSMAGPAGLAGPAGPAVDATDVDLATLDPPGSMDLDQAFAVAAAPGGGWVVHYAIADLAALIEPDGPVDREARARVETMYSPDESSPLHPRVLSEGAASLLPGQDRRALLWRFELDAHAEVRRTDLTRAVVRSRARLDYAGVQAQLAAGTAPTAIAELARLGPLRQELAVARGAIELGLPEQVVERAGSGWTLRLRAQLPVEQWNAELSLMTGMAAARIMLDAGVGVLRTLPAAPPGAEARLRRAAPALGVVWPEGEAPGRVLATLSADDPGHLAFLDLAAELLRGAGYRAFLDGDVPDAADAVHAGVGSTYAHVTAPIRRLVDRFANEVCVAVTAGAEVPGWVRDALPELPERMADGDRRAHALQRAAIDLTEAWLLADRVGEVFDAAVVDRDDERPRATVALDDPAVRARCDDAGALEPGHRCRVRLVEADPATRTVRFEPAA